MAKTPAERQENYRKQRPFAGSDGNGERRINSWVSSGTVFALRRLSTRYGVTNRQMLEQLIREADDRIVATLVLDSVEWDAYYKG